jgi:hypothetical protein
MYGEGEAEGEGEGEGVTPDEGGKYEPNGEYVGDKYDRKAESPPLPTTPDAALVPGTAVGLGTGNGTR